MTTPTPARPAATLIAPRRAVYFVAVSHHPGTSLSAVKTNEPPENRAVTACINAVSIILLLSLPVSMIAIGAIHINNCPAEPFIPIYMIVAGILFILRLVIQFGNLLIEKYKNTISITLRIIDLLNFIWLITGSFWVYNIFKPNYYDSTSLIYCNKLVYLFAFIIITLTYIVYFCLIVFSVLLRR
uniref:MARVEL domain-containing protein n=1 Tax=Strigamia maritima TaxID=126957 RepID=T1IYQ1_STRMM